MNASLYLLSLTATNLNTNIIFKSSGSEETCVTENNNPFPFPTPKPTPESSVSGSMQRLNVS